MSRTFRLNKLVRDGIVPDMHAKGQQPEFHALSEEQRVAALKDKLLEESAEYDLPDLLEVIESLANAEGKTFDDIRQEQLAKREKIGGFTTGTYVETVTLNDDDEWAEYYAADPDRYPEEV